MPILQCPFTPCGQNMKILKIYFYDVITLVLYCAVSGEQLRIFEGRGLIHEKGYNKNFQRKYGLRILFRRFIVRGITVEGLLISML